MLGLGGRVIALVRFLVGLALVRLVGLALVRLALVGLVGL